MLLVGVMLGMRDTHRRQVVAVARDLWNAAAGLVVDVVIAEAFLSRTWPTLIDCTDAGCVVWPAGLCCSGTSEVRV